MTVTAAVVQPAPATAGTVDYFNDYGTTETNANGLGGTGGGWAGPWTISGDYIHYKPGTALIYGGRRYSAPLNQMGTGDGTLSAISGAGGGNIIVRSFDVDTNAAGSQGMTGTVWISCLANVAANGRDILMFLGNAGGNQTAVGLRGSSGTAGGSVPEPMIKYNFVTDTSNDVDFAAGVTHLFLVKVAMNVTGTSDSVDFWIDPTLGPTAPASTPLYSKSGADACGATFASVGFSFSSLGGTVDALRVSNDAHGYALVTGVQGPGPTLLIR